MEAELKEAIAAEEKAIAGFSDLKASKEKEIEMATEAIETKMGRAGDIAVSVVQSKDALEDAQDAAADATKFLATLEKDCADAGKKHAESTKLRSMEISAISDAIGILNDDDALDVFKKALPSSFVQTVGFLQQADAKASRVRKAQAIIAGLAGKTKNVQLNLMLYTFSSKLKLNLKKLQTKRQPPKRSSLRLTPSSLSSLIQLAHSWRRSLDLEPPSRPLISQWQMQLSNAKRSTRSMLRRCR